MPVGGIHHSNRRGMQPMAVDRHGEIGKQHRAHGHLVNHRVEPLEQQQIVGRAVAVDRHVRRGPDASRIGDHRGERKSRLAERLRFRRADAGDADVGSVRKVLPPR
jgi:hypothetical protein